MYKKSLMWWSPNVRWVGVADARGQSWLILGKFKIQINPINLTFPGGRKFMMQSYMQHPCWSLCFFLLSTIFPGRHGTWHLKSQTQYPSRMIHVIEHLSKLQSVHLQFHDNWYFSKVQLAWEQRHLSICNSMHFRFEVNRCWFPSKEINPLLIYFTI